MRTALGASALLAYVRDILRRPVKAFPQNTYMIHSLFVVSTMDFPAQAESISGSSESLYLVFVW